VIASLVWKEYREHRSVWLALALFAVATLVIVKEWLLPSGWAGGTGDAAGMVVGAAFVLAAMYGLVCGAMMFAGERETRGMAFLDTLPLSRVGMWWAKCLIGAAFTLLFSVVVIATGFALRLIGPGAVPAVLAPLLPAVALQVYCVGLCASTFFRTVLTAVAVAALGPLPVLWLLSGMCLAASGSGSGHDDLPGVVSVIMFHALGAAAALGVSMYHFLDRDFEKRFVFKPLEQATHGTEAPKRQPRRWEVLLWLALRRGGIVAGVLAALGFFAGLGLPAAGTGLWPAASLLVGVACGIMVFAAEQAEGASKFLGDQRLPVGWLWLRRTAVWAGIAAAVAGLMLLGALLALAAQPKNLPDDADAFFARLMGAAPGEFGPVGVAAFLLLWPAHGFALGQYCSLVWRKSAVALVVSVMAAAGAACVWVPSLLGGGLYAVQVLGVPLLLLGACRLVQWDWVTDRLKTRPAVVRMVGGVLLACAWVGANLAYRVLEVPGGGTPFDMAALRASLADPEQNRAAQKIREGLGKMDEQVRAAEGARLANVRQGRPFEEQAARVVEYGREAADPAFDRLLDRVAAGEWVDQVRQGAMMAPGVFIDPRSLATRNDAADCRRAATLLTAWAIQLQARGDEEAALERLVTVLALSRHMRHQVAASVYLDGLEVERTALQGMEHWLTRLRQPDLLKRALVELTRHEAETTPVGEALAGEYLRCLSTLGTTARMGTSAETQALLTQTPWEAERARRLVDALFAGRRRLADAGDLVPVANDRLLADWAPARDGPQRADLERLLGSSWLADSLPATAPLQRGAMLGTCRVRGTRLQIALALYQRQHGKPAPLLEALMPAILEEVPEDPFVKQPFRYRVSKGESIAWPRDLPRAEFVRKVAAGQGVVWSAGPDGSDDGGTRQWLKDVPGCDVIFLVPK
jgi:ABC-type transport system involved in multi-copper enzyme maturation permease subunit